MDKNAVNRTHNYKKRFFSLSYPFSYLSSLSVWVHKSFFLYYYFLIFISICVCCCCCVWFLLCNFRKGWNEKTGFSSILLFETLSVLAFEIKKKNRNTDKNWNKKKWKTKQLKQKKNLETFYKFVGFDVQKLDLNYLKIKNMVEKYKLKLCGNVALT